MKYMKNKDVSQNSDKFQEIVCELTQSGYKVEKVEAIKITFDGGYYIIIPANNKQGYETLYKYTPATR